MSYEPTIWKKGDKVTSTKLNKIENGIQGNDEEITSIKEGLTEITVEHTITSINLNDEVYEYGRFNMAGDEYNSDTPITVAFRSAEYLPVEGGKTIEWYGYVDRANIPTALPMQIVQYDANKDKISARTDLYRISYPNQTTALTLNANTAYIRFDFNHRNADFGAIKVSIYYSENAVAAYTPYVSPTTVKCVNYDAIIDENGISASELTSRAVYNQFFNKKIAYNGDSICEGRTGNGGYPQIIADVTGCYFENRGESGAHLATYANRHVVCDEVSAMPDDADLVCFEGGINDYWANCQIGTLTSGYTDSIDTSTLMGAMESIFRQAIEKWKGVPICFIIVHKVRGTDTVSNSNGDTFADFHDAMIEACNKYSIPYLDMFLNGGMNCNIQGIAENYTAPSERGQWGVDGCHPNENGYKTFYVPKLIAFFSQLLQHI